MFAGLSKPPYNGGLGSCPFYGGGSVAVDLLLIFLPLCVGVLCFDPSFVMHYLVYFQL